MAGALLLPAAEAATRTPLLVVGFYLLLLIAALATRHGLPVWGWL